jgi:hypothetical protein
MRGVSYRVLPLVFCVGLSACAGRTAQPVSIAQSYDPDLSCTQIQAEITANEQKARQLSKENDSAHSANVAIGVVGALVFWPALFAIDAGNAEPTEMAALRARDEHLVTLADVHGCNGKGAKTTGTTTTPAAPSAL